MTIKPPARLSQGDKAKPPDSAQVTGEDEYLAFSLYHNQNRGNMFWKKNPPMKESSL